MANKKIATIITVVLVTIMISMALISNARPVEISASSTTDINLNVKVAIYSGGWAGGATVTLTYPDGKTYTGTTNKGGECHFSNVPPGNCTVTATLNGATAGLPVSLKTGNNDITITLPETWVSASFTTDVTSGDYPLTVVFTDTSTGYPVPSSWDWDFGDGSAHVYMKDASHTYASAGTYTATLTVGNSAGDSDSATTTITVTTPVVPPETWVVASFTPDVTSGDYPLAVVFTDASTGSPVPSSWHWDFGDGVSYDGKASSHTYTTAGTYTVTLTVKNSANDVDTAMATITVTTPPPPPKTWVLASFTTDVTSGDYPLGVSFTDTSTGSPDPSSWDWNFGDGWVQLNSQNAMHTYTSAGTYTVTLTVRNSEGDEDTATTTITVMTPVQPPETWVSASFNTDKASGDYPLDVSFTDTSSGDPVPSSWHWNFGDGSAHVYTQNAMHTYTSAGTYTVTLTVRNSEGDEDTATTTIMVTTPAQPETWIVASFTPDVTSGNNPLTVVFTDASTGSPVPSSWHWDFGDGVQQDGQAATHTYVSDGDFTVTLTVGNSDGDTDAATAVITVMTPNPCPSPTGPSHITIALPPQSDMSYIYENNILSWIVTGPVNNPTITAYNLFVWGTGLFS